MSGMPDASPSQAGVGKTGDHPNGMKNQDSRLGGSKWNNEKSPYGGQDGVPSFEAKSVGAEPNDGAPTLGSKGVIGHVQE